ncbi:hypothetical protein C8Q79DRAFT_1008307 [Trametes meyenii]|nr:hypothetical protein C8Q79DRAFT_1008307 [Trametes meyenii]
MPCISVIRRCPLEVLEKICQALKIDTSETSRRHLSRCTLLNIARTCKFLSELALNILWHVIPDIAVLLLILPKDAYERCLVRESGGILVDLRLNMTAHLLETPFPQLLVYGRRVRRICYTVDMRNNGTAGLTAAPSAYDSLAEALGHRTLLPNLEVLKYKIRPNTPLSIFRSFHVLFGPKLEWLAMHRYAASWQAVKPPSTA